MQREQLIGVRSGGEPVLLATSHVTHPTGLTRSFVLWEPWADDAVVLRGCPSVSLTDRAKLLTNLTIPCEAGINGDGMLSPADFNAWIQNFNTGC